MSEETPTWQLGTWHGCVITFTAGPFEMHGWDRNALDVKLSMAWRRAVHIYLNLQVQMRHSAKIPGSWKT